MVLDVTHGSTPLLLGVPQRCVQLDGQRALYNATLTFFYANFSSSIESRLNAMGYAREIMFISTPGSAYRLQQDIELVPFQRLSSVALSRNLTHYGM